MIARPTLPAILVAALLILPSGLGQPAAAQTAPATVPPTLPQVTKPVSPDPRHVLWVGNSFFYYNNGMQSMVARLIGTAPEADRRPYESTMAAIGGSGLDWHDMESYFRPNAVGSYNFDRENNVIPARRAKLWDAVIMMDCSQCPINPSLSGAFTEYARRDSEIARSHGAEPILFMSWAYADHPEMTAQLAEAYTKAANDNHALVIPAGLAFARAHAARPDLVLYQPDRRHPTLAGTYLAASTVYAALYGRSPEPITDTEGLDPELARFLRHTAWQTVQAYTGAE